MADSSIDFGSHLTGLLLRDVAFCLFVAELEVAFLEAAEAATTDLPAVVSLEFEAEQ